MARKATSANFYTKTESKRGMSIHLLSAYRFPCVRLRRAGTWKSLLGVKIYRAAFSLAFLRTYHGEPFLHNCNVLTESWHCYGLGGYHPVLLGDQLNHGTHKILHNWAGVVSPQCGLLGI